MSQEIKNVLRVQTQFTNFLDIKKIFNRVIQKIIITLFFYIKKLFDGFANYILIFIWYRKSKDAMNGLFYVHQHKPDFCELFIICGGKQVSPRVKNGEITMEDDNGVKVAKMRDKMSFKDWLERMISDKTIDSNHKNSSRSPISSTYLEAHLEQNYIQEIENYLHELVSLNFEEGSFGQDNHDSFVTPIEPYFQKLQISDNKVHN